MDRFTKRLKRHLIGPVQEFFVVTAPGLETLCRDEIISLPISSKEVQITDGGVSFHGRLTDCFLANLHLRTATRILMRVGRFRAADFGALEKKAGDIPWELYLPPETTFKLNVTSHKSRLYHSDAIVRRMAAVIDRQMARFHPHDAGIRDRRNGQQIFVRAVKDRFTVSVDSSGEALYKRGIKRHGGPAPVRETLAAALLIRMGYAGDRVLLDPMCGTGTFSLEAALMALNIPPGWHRDFAFGKWPAFRPKTWAYIRGQAQKRIIAGPGAPIKAFDLEQSACDRLGDCIRQRGLDQSIGVSEGDFFHIDPGQITDRPGYVILNPPYGRRLGKPGETGDLQAAVLAKLRRDYPGWRLGMLLPVGRPGKTIPLELEGLTVLHGGLRVKLLTGMVPGGR